MEVVRKQLAKLVCPRLSHVSLKELCGGEGWGRELWVPCVQQNCKAKCALSHKDSRTQKQD